ncbi:Hsp70 family protein [Noviherbaspirillum humi]|nr:Hsp70 family protein [Noviherbaspirillum humi]
MTRYTVGIDLGTTHTVVAYAEAGGSDIRLFDVEQLVAPGEAKALPLLPSLRFHAAPGALPPAELQLPWSEPLAEGDAPVVFGALGRRLGAQVPGRLVASAKSWLSHAAVDRLAPILPWGAPAEVPKVSPMEASASYLAYVRAAWNWRHPDQPLERQDIVLTVPASFDEAARALTVQAAHLAGLPRLRLLEEPQAALYDWLFRHRENLQAELAQSRLILVVDVGGGTTDLSLIQVELQEGEPRLTRIGVGKHLMLGGDNMDLVLAHLAESRLAPPGEGGNRKLGATELSQLIDRCRAAKEQLLATDAPARTVVTLLGAGARLIGGSRSVELERGEVERLVVDGFFPQVGPQDGPQQRRSGIVEFGLPYASDPAITRHLAGFLMLHAAASRTALGQQATDTPAIPDTLLLNGGVFRSPALAGRLRATLDAWRGTPLTLLHNENPDVAVARGAVAFALAGAGLAPKIGGGSARSYFLRLDEPGRTATRAVCVLPRGSEEGRELLLQDRVFALRLGQPVRFHLVSATADDGNAPPRPGELVDIDESRFAPLPPIAAVLPADAGAARQEVPVRLAASLTEVGTLQMQCVSTEDVARRWSLEFQLRGDAEAAPAEEAAAMPPRFDDAIAQIERIFGARAQKVMPKEVRQLRAQLERLIGVREQWATPLLRRLFDALWQRARGRRRSAEHERAWLNLAGWCLRPGFGDPLDDWRMAQLWPLFEKGTQYRNDAQVSAEWWTLWRRVAGGLASEAQLRVLDDFAYNVQGADAGIERPAQLVPGNQDDMLRLIGALERIPASYKAEIGDWLLGLLDQPAGGRTSRPADGLVLWALARLGARQPFYGSAHDVVPPETAAAWVEKILALDWKRSANASLAAAHLSRLTGDRSRDLPEPLRQRVIVRLKASGAPSAWAAMVAETQELDEASRQSFVGDSLPPGLKLIA